jgi:hypothetical protein
MKRFRISALMGFVFFTAMVLTSCLSSKDGDNKATQEVISLYQN